MPLSEELLLEHTTVVGTLPKTRHRFHQKMQLSNARPERSSLFGFAGNVTIVSSVPSKGKAVLLLSINAP